MVQDSDTSVFILSGDRRSQTVLEALLRQCCASVSCLARREDCLSRLSRGPCDLLIIDCDGDAADQLTVLAEIRQISSEVSSIVLVEPGDISGAVRAMKLGATDCLEKPVKEEQLLSMIDAGLDGARQHVIASGRALTKAETEVLRLLVAGKTNKGIAEILHRSRRTVEVHRRSIMHKLGVSGIVSLIKSAAAMGFVPAERDGHASAE